MRYNGVDVESMGVVWGCIEVHKEDIDLCLQQFTDSAFP